MKSYDTVVEALQELKQQGFILDFNLSFDKLTCTDTNIYLHPNDFEIVNVFRFEGETNPEDEDIVYAIQSKDGTLKGTLTSAFGMYADTVSAEMLQQLSVKK